MSPDSKTAPAPYPRVAAALQRLKDTRQEGGVAAVEEIVSQLLGCEEHALLAVKEDATRLELVAAMGLSPERLQALLVPQGIIGLAARHGVPYIVGRTSSIGTMAHELGLTACIPLVRARQVIGVLALFRMLPQKRGLNDEDLELLDLLATYGVNALSEPRRNVMAHAVVEAPRASSVTHLPEAGAGAPRTFYLEPGALVVASRPMEVTTILGSCVAVCLWDEQSRIGGMNHFLLPTTLNGQPASARHGEAAIPMLVRELERLGCQRKNLRAKIFGGAHLARLPSPGAGPPLGQRNAELAQRLLREAGIPIISQDLGGNVGRKLRFRTDDGTALVKSLGPG